MRFYLINNFSTSDYLIVTSQEVCSELDWGHLVIYYNGSLNASGMKIYKDGASLTLDINQDSLSGTTITSGPFNIGAYNDGLSPFNGILDEVLIFNRTLSDPEVIALFNASASYRNNFTGLNKG